MAEQQYFQGFSAPMTINNANADQGYPAAIPTNHTSAPLIPSLLPYHPNDRNTLHRCFILLSTYILRTDMQELKGVFCPQSSVITTNQPFSSIVNYDRVSSTFVSALYFDQFKQCIHAICVLLGRRQELSRDILPLSLYFMWDFRCKVPQDNLAGMSITMDECITVAVEIAAKFLGDHCSRLKSWSRATNLSIERLIICERVFLRFINYETWARKEKFTDFMTRVGRLWREVLRGWEVE